MKKFWFALAALLLTAGAAPAQDFPLRPIHFIIAFGPGGGFGAYSIFFAGVIGVWILAAFLLGKRFERAVAHNEVIGAEKE